MSKCKQFLAIFIIIAVFSFAFCPISIAQNDATDYASDENSYSSQEYSSRAIGDRTLRWSERDQALLDKLCDGTIDFSVIRRIIDALRSIKYALDVFYKAFGTFEDTTFDAKVSAEACGSVDLPDIRIPDLDFKACSGLDLPDTNPCIDECASDYLDPLLGELNEKLKVCIDTSEILGFEIPETIAACASGSVMGALDLRLPKLDFELDLDDVIDRIEELIDLLTRLEEIGCSGSSTSMEAFFRAEGSAFDKLCSLDISLEGLGLGAAAEWLTEFAAYLEAFEMAMHFYEELKAEYVLGVNACIGFELPELPKISDCYGADFALPMDACVKVCASDVLSKMGIDLASAQNMLNSLTSLCGFASIDLSAITEAVAMIPDDISGCIYGNFQTAVSVPLPKVDLGLLADLRLKIKDLGDLSATLCGFTFPIVPRGEISPSDFEARETTVFKTFMNPDMDGDGIITDVEMRDGTNPFSSDSDGDGVKDKAESLVGSNPLDKGSYVKSIDTTICSEWNGFLGGLYNILEHVNRSNDTIKFVTTIYDINGSPVSSNKGSILPGAQTDILVHGMKGRVANSYGKVCTTHDGGVGELDGRMVYYRTNGGGYDFAFAMPFSGGERGVQYVGFNTFQPSLDLSDMFNLVANWIQIMNLNSHTASGSLVMYDMNGELLDAQEITLSAGARRDVSAHEFGPSKVGLLIWHPSNKDDVFQVRNVRYVYATPLSYLNEFTTAFQLEGRAGTGQQVSAPVDTRDGTSVLELSNTKPKENKVSVKIYNSAGVLVHTETAKLKPYATKHVIVDGLLQKSLGVAVVDSDQLGGVIATVMQYGRTKSRGIKYMYGIPAIEPFGVDLSSSYNTFLNQKCNMYIVNQTNSVQSGTISMVRYDGAVLLSGARVTVPAHGVLEQNVCTQDRANSYGVVELKADVSNTLLGHVVRVGQSDSYRFPTPLRE